MEEGRMIGGGEEAEELRGSKLPYTGKRNDTRQTAGVDGVSIREYAEENTTLNNIPCYAVQLEDKKYICPPVSRLSSRKEHDILTKSDLVLAKIW